MRSIVVFIISVAVSQYCLAHEYWLQPEKFQLQTEDSISADIRVGQHFKGDTYAYLPTEIETAEIHLANTSKPIKGRFGDIPAINTAPLGDGLNILTVASSPFQLTYNSAEKFRDFLKYDGIEWVQKEHEKRGLAETGFIEAYRRHAKTLIKVGNGLGSDRRTGLEFEWVMLTNPYTNKVDKISAQLWWRDKVFANAAFRVFMIKDGKVSESAYVTDANGVASFPRIADTIYMINAVHMILPANELVVKMKAVWESRWASVTFATP
jgi:hypothetical protein